MATQATTKEEVLTRLAALGSLDYERSHIEADSLLLDALLLAGMHDVVAAYQAARDEIGFLCT